jgi:hypothetical protein
MPFQAHITDTRKLRVMWITKQSRAILENLIVPYVLREVLNFYGTRRFTVVYTHTRALH